MIKLIRHISGILFILGIAVNSYGQQPVRVPVPARRYYPGQAPVLRYTPGFRPGRQLNRPVNKVEVVKESFISRQLQLTPQQSKAFLPIYRQYVQDQTAVRILKRQNNSTTTPDGTSQIDRDLEYDTELINIKKHYRDEFLRILPPEKVSELYKSEREFNDEVLRQLSERSARAGN
jgi:hypothetical protein